ncbi:MAG: iron ABC transporter [Candidatus Reconcilbacillus cellulovorans]|uniref:Iron ABC transporter n=1 Tax=Candidatus Reconcilbacillus cellulovorans TaxID=1906605 RepID=A0A2A6E0C1_9BACL|nr:MAG: iron ABC transporter [Candidatus Reconcilbacillus cellulovorans]
MIPKNRTFRFAVALAAGTLALAGMFAVSMIAGAADVSVRDVWLAMTSRATGEDILIVRELRLPRELGAMLVGAAFGVSGAIMQGLTRNPLADPGLLGLTAGANVALAVAFALLPGIGFLGTTFVCFAGAALGAVLVVALGAFGGGRLSPLRVVLTGAAVSTFLQAVAEGVSLLFKISKEVSMWTAGGLIGTTWTQLQILAPIVFVCTLAALAMARQLTVLSMSEEVAVGLGQKRFQTRTLLFVIVILLSGGSVALAGNMAFVGLMIPHLVRPLVGHDYRQVLPMSVIAGAAFMLLADTLGRTVNAPYETPMAAIVALLGLPFFLYVVHKEGKAPR